MDCGFTPTTEYVNVGRYSGLRGVGPSDGSNLNEGPFVAYHPVDLTKVGWVPDSTVTSNVMGLRIPQIRGASGKVFKIDIPSTDQFFLLANHQDTTSSSYDAEYKGSGLLMWHVLRSGTLDRAWDVESAAGKFDSGGSPDAVAGLDSLEANWCFPGGASDFFDGDTYTDFNWRTNPNSNLYASFLYTSDQSTQTDVAIENVVMSGTDMLVDVYFDRAQHVTAPNGGFHAAGEDLIVTWKVRDAAYPSSTVSLGISADNGVTWPVNHTSVSNTGSHNMGSLVTFGSEFLVRVVSTDDSSTAWTDLSDNTFTVWGVENASVAGSNLQGLPGLKFSLDVDWDTSIVANDGDSVVFYRSAFGGTPISSNCTSGCSADSTHSGTWEVSGCATGNWWYEVKSTEDGGVNTSSPRKKIRIRNCLN